MFYWSTESLRLIRSSNTILKLIIYGFRGPIYNIMVDYLSCRSQQYVFANGSKSNIAEIITGVPQGSVVAPFLFLIYINGLPQTLQNNNKIAIFADDTVFELFILDVFRGIFSQLRFYGTTKFSKHIVDSEHQKNARIWKRALANSLQSNEKYRLNIP